MKSLEEQFIIRWKKFLSGCFWFCFFVLAIFGLSFIFWQFIK